MKTYFVGLKPSKKNNCIEMHKLEIQSVLA
jgi:hypothetical protein